MTNFKHNDIKQRYFRWMCGLVRDDSLRTSDYKKLFAQLHAIEFQYFISMDSNRADDGIDLRYRFGYEEGIPQRDIADSLDIYPCSVLEMLVALCFRCEEHIMCDPDIGDRTGKWFWDIIDNMGLIGMTDSNYDSYEVEQIVSRFLNREYEPDGRGGLVTIKDCKYDLRDVELWNQMMWHLNEVLDG